MTQGNQFKNHKRLGKQEKNELINRCYFFFQKKVDLKKNST